MVVWVSCKLCGVLSFSLAVLLYRGFAGSVAVCMQGCCIRQLLQPQPHIKKINHVITLMLVFVVESGRANALGVRD